MRLKRIGILAGITLLLLMSCWISFGADTTTDTTTTKLTPEEMTLKEGAEQGELCGQIDGNADGIVQYFEGYSSEYYKGLLTDTSIIGKYNLANDDVFYKLEFLKAYKAAYIIAYQSAYRRVNLLTVNSSAEKAYDQGMEMGTIEGGFNGVNDLFNGKFNDWEKSYANYLATGSLNNRFWLDRENMEYRLKFSAGFKEGYLKSYIENYQTQNMALEKMNRNYKLVTLREETIHFDDEYVHYVSGAMEKETRTPATLYLPAASITTPTYISLFKVQNTNHQNPNFKPVSSRYSIGVLNDLGQVELLKPIKLSFEYFGSEKAGIYKWSDTHWEYQYTTLEDGIISTDIPVGAYSGGEYAIFIDDKFNNILDIRFNWAYKEIYTLMRRGVINSGVDFEPDRSLTKQELSDMIYKIKIPKQNYETSNQRKIKDVESVNASYDAISYALDNGYFTLTSNSMFYPNQTVTYQDFQNILSKILNRNFNWSEISKSMLTEKFSKSEGINNIQGNINRAECAYALCTLIR